MLRSHHKTLWGKSIDHDGVVYPIDANGYLPDSVPEAVRTQFLAQRDNWYDDENIPKLGSPAEQRAVTQTAQPEPKHGKKGKR